MIYQGNARHAVREAILHCAAIRTGQFKHMRPFQVFATINQWHIERGFKNGFGYHGLIMPDGEYYSGRPYSMIGAHVIGRNAGTLGFLLIESRQVLPEVEEKDKYGHVVAREPVFDDWFTQAQAARLRFLLRTVPGLEKVSGHNDYAPKLCPGFKVRTEDWL